MKNILYITFLLFVIGCSNNSAIINGDMKMIDSSEVSLFVRDSTTEKRLIAKTIVENNKFSFVVENIKTPTYAYIITMGSEVTFVLEPGTTTIRSTNGGSAMATGTKYNDMLYGWRLSDDAKRIDQEREELNKLISSPDYSEKTEEQRKEVTAKYRKCFSEQFKLERVALDSILTLNDSYAKLFAIIRGNRCGDSEIAILAEIEKEIGSNMEIENLRNRYNEANADKLQMAKIAVGMNFIDITGVYADGTTEIKLSDIVAKNKLTMLEFWASWCAPCRAEIPNMKRCYETFHKKGFEIFSFSIDSSHEKWLKAEEVENLKWVSTTGNIEEVSRLYVIKSIPANFLIDSTGKIVARNLRGKELDKFVEEFLLLSDKNY